MVVVVMVVVVVVVAVVMMLLLVVVVVACRLHLFVGRERSNASTYSHPPICLSPEKERNASKFSVR